MASSARYRSAVSVFTLVTGLHLQASQDQATFRADVRVVSIYASAFRGKTPVSGLTATDFSVMDNGVKQNVDDVLMESAGTDVVCLIDVSGSFTSGFRDRLFAEVDD